MQRLPIQRAIATAVICLTGVVIAAEFKLKDGSTLNGEGVSFTDKGVVLRTPDNKALPRAAWTNFTQEALKEFAKNPKARPFVELLIEDATPPGGPAADLNVPEPVTPKREWKQPKEVEAKPTLPEQPGLLGGMFGTGVGWFTLVMMYAAVIYAGYEVANYRRRPKQLVMGLSAIPGLGFLAPIVFLCLPAVKTEEEAKPTAVQQAMAAAKEAPKEPEKPMPGKKKPGLAFGKKAEEGGGHAAAGAKPVAVAKPAAAAAAPAAASPVKAPAAPASAKLEPAVYRRGETNINKRFIETKFAGFFKAIPAAPEKDMWLVWVTATGSEFWSKRVVSITQTEVVVNCPQEGGGTLDQTVQIVEISEIHLRPQEG